MMKKQHSKSKAKSNPKPKKDEAAVTLGDMLGSDLVNQLKNKQQELKAEEERKKEAEEQLQKEKKRLKEKNKSFEELLNETSMNWKNFK